MWGSWLANVPLVGRLRVGERLAGVPRFLRQIFYVHWVYILIVLGLFAALCFGFASDLAGGSGLGRFLSGFMAGFWLLRIVLQVFYYDPELRRENRGTGYALCGIADCVGGDFWDGGGWVSRVAGKSKIPTHSERTREDGAPGG